MTLDRTRARNIADNALHALGTTTPCVSPLRVRLMTTVGSATANGTELATSGGYTAGAAAPTVTMGAADTTGTSTNTTAVTVTNMPATTINGIETWDSTGTPIRQELGTLAAPKTTAAGDTLSFAVAAISSVLA